MKNSIPIIGIILAAGGSTRMGKPKSLLPLNNPPVISCHINTLLSVCTDVIVVLGANAPMVKQALATHKDTISIVENPMWASTGQIDSLRVALNTVKKQHAVLVTPVDTPPASSETLHALCGALPKTVVPLSPKGERGHPVLLSPETIVHIRTSTMPFGLRSYLDTADTVDVSDDLMHVDFDTPNEWREFLSRWTNRP